MVIVKFVTFPNALILEASRAISRYAAHQRVLEAMALRLPLQRVLTRLAQSIEDAAPGSICAIMLIDASGTRLVTGAAPNLPQEYNDGIDGAVIGPGEGSCGAAIVRRERVIAADISTDPLWANYKHLALSHDLRACWCTPIIAHGGVLGSFAMYYRSVHFPSATEVSVVDDAVDLACVAIGLERTELSVRVSEAHYRAVMETAPSPIVGLAPDQRVIEWNQAAEQLFGRARADVMTQHFSSVCLTGESRATFELCFQESLAQQANSVCEVAIVRSDGTTRWSLWSMSPIIADAGDPGGMLAIAQDITGRMEAEAALRRSEQQLRHSQKMEAVGRLAGGIAHDFNNLLTVILGNASLALHDASPGSPQQTSLEELRDAATRATSLTRQLLTFSRREPVEPRLLNLNLVVDDLRRMLGRIIGEHIQLQTQLSPVPVVVRADRTNVEQLLINLVVNARDAMGDGGVLDIVTEGVKLDDEAAAARALASGSYLRLRVSDTGCGMDEETRARAFEPFFTTKPSGEGTGLGLATVYAIASQHGGAVEIESQPGVGTTVTLWLPSVTGTAVLDHNSGEHPAERGTGTVLIVEDEEAVRHLTRRVLVAHGYQVLEAANGEEALRLWKQCSQEVDVLVTDVVMPKMGGKALADRLRADRPDLAVVFCSGYSDNIFMPMSDADAHTAFLAKPFTLQGLLERVARLAATARSRPVEPPPGRAES